jgi:hypothetical protein
MRPFIWLRRIPVFGTLVWLANCYAYGGDGRAGTELAPFKLWLKAYFWNLVASALLVAFTLPDFSMSVWKHFVSCKPVLEKLTGIGASPGTMIVSVFPNLLGLGIGIYALLFALDTSFVRQMHRKLEEARRDGRRKHGSVLILNSDIAFPLSVMVVVVAIGVISQAYPDVLWVQIASWLAFWYGLVLVLEIISLLFLLIDNSILEKADSKGQEISSTPTSNDTQPPSA